MKRQNEYLLGKRPYQYRYEKTSHLNKEVFLNTYTLHTDDWFESGTRFAYSFHKNLDSALKYKGFSWWVCDNHGKIVFVSNNTLEAIIKEKKGLFVSMED